MNQNGVIITENDRRFMDMAIRLAKENVENGGGPFGAVLVKDGMVVATGVNTVTKSNDPTAHAEVNAIRNACQEGQTFSLEGCVIYCSCEPCPMCLSAIYWAHIKRVYYAASSEDAAAVDFSDSFIYRELDKPNPDRSIPCICIENSEATSPFIKWSANPDKIEY